jgi:hypothetical protein
VFPPGSFGKAGRQRGGFGAAKGLAEAHYALEGLPNKVLAAEYRTVLPDERLLAEELVRTRRRVGRSASLRRRPMMFTSMKDSRHEAQRDDWHSRALHKRSGFLSHTE